MSPPSDDRRAQATTPAPSVARPARVRGYEELDGGEGRERFFRPDRYRAGDFGPVAASVVIAGPDGPVACPLVDVSQSGVAFAAPPATLLDKGATLADLAVRFDGYEAYRGAARIGSLREVDGVRIVGAAFLDSLMNVEDVLQLRNVKTWNGESALGLGLGARPWRTTGHARFKARVAELRLYFEDLRGELASLEASLPWQVVHGDGDSPARAALVERIRHEVARDVVQLSADIDAALREAGPDEVPALREYAQRHLQSFLMMSPWMERAWRKPFGYPGDFEVMRFVYERNFEGATLLAKAIGLAFLETPAAVAVKARKDLVKGELARLVAARAAEGRPVRILSVAAGPAQETWELLRDATELPPTEILLFDQDKRALAYAFPRLKRLVDQRWQGRVRIVYLHDAIRRVLLSGDAFAAWQPFDAIISCGLFDYLEMHTAGRLCRNLYACLAPGGELLVGNMVPSNPSRWFMELHLDWHLVYRTHAEMLTFASRAGATTPPTILEDATGVNPFVKIVRD